MGAVTWSFEGKTVVVTGGSRGIGLATANLFARSGAHVLALSRTGATDELHPDTQALVIAFPASDASSYMTGQTVLVDGGQLLV